MLQEAFPDRGDEPTQAVVVDDGETGESEGTGGDLGRAVGFVAPAPGELQREAASLQAQYQAEQAARAAVDAEIARRVQAALDPNVGRTSTDILQSLQRLQGSTTPSASKKSSLRIDTLFQAVVSSDVSGTVA